MKINNERKIIMWIMCNEMVIMRNNNEIII